MKPLALSPVTKANYPKNNCLTNRKPTRISGIASQLTISNSMNWNFQYPIILQGTAKPTWLQYISQMEAYGVDVVARVSGGYQVTKKEKTPIFNLVEDAIQAVGEIGTSMIFAPPDQVLDASLEAIASGIKQLIIITPHVPPLDTVELLKVAQAHNIAILGPGSSGITIPEKYCLGTLQPQYFRPGNVGIISYGKALLYEVAWALNEAKMGQSWGISLGQDKIICSHLVQWLKILDEDDSTEAIVLIQSAQDIDYDALEFLSEFTTKPVICYVIGSQTPTDKVFRQGIDILNNHLSNSIPATNSYRKTITTIKKFGAIVANKPSEIPQLVNQALNIASD
ncbi:succinate--CoA ligase subunit alpha [Hyella patelloides]|nr:CoA-binding protein [Hyella patelloides]